MPSQKPLIALNLKAYAESSGARGIKLCEIASEVSMLTGVRVIVCPDATLLSKAAEGGADVFAQAVDGTGPGAFTGSINAFMLKEAGAKGSLLNHSERRIPAESIQNAIAALHSNGLESMLCTKDIRESVQYSVFKPTYIAIEPPELIGSGISVSSAKPEVVRGAVQSIRQYAPDVRVICGAGISNAADVKKAIELGAEGVLLASAYVRSKDPRKLLTDMAGQL